MTKLKGYHQKKNCVRFNVANSLVHEMKKAELCFQAQRKGFSYVTEAEFTGGGRADIYLLDTDTVIEILNTETKERFEKKDYPVSSIIGVRVDQEFEI